MLTKIHTLEICTVALKYHRQGFSVIPCKADKRPTGNWREYTARRAKLHEVEKWYSELDIQSIGLIGGRVSGNVVFIDLDGIPAIQQFAFAFPSLCESTKSVLTGSQKGIHLYVRVDEIPDNINVRVQGVGGFEIRGNGQYVIAPPSPHPSGHTYRVYRDRAILHLPHINDVRDWMDNLRLNNQYNQNESLKSHPARIQSVQVARRKASYLKTVINQELARVETSGRGNRNDSLFNAGIRLANFAAGGELDWSDCETLLYQSAMRVFSADERMEVTRTIASAFRIGSKYPKVVP